MGNCLNIMLSNNESRETASNQNNIIMSNNESRETASNQNNIIMSNNESRETASNQNNIIMSNNESRETASNQNNFEGTNGMSGRMESNGINSLVGLHDEEQEQNHLQQARRSEDSWYYNMNNTERGWAIILNHYEFNECEPREGTDLDKERLATVLENLGFNVKQYTDLTLNGIIEVLKEASQENHANNDCFVLAVLTHGERGNNLWAKDLQYNFSLLWKAFTDENCGTLKSKPRLFFVQACRGQHAESAVELQYQTETDSTNICGISEVPNIDQHFLVAFSTGQGCYSWRSESEGTWFIQTLCDELVKFAYTKDINFILNQVSRRVAIEFQSNIPPKIGSQVSLHEKKQMPCTVTKLTQLLKFTKKK